MGLTTRNQGVSVASLASRLSVVIPIVAAFFLYSDSIGLAKITGIILSIFALYLSSKKNNEDVAGIGKLRVFFSDSSEQNEGEHKIFEFITC